MDNIIICIVDARECEDATANIRNISDQEFYNLCCNGDEWTSITDLASFQADVNSRTLPGTDDIVRFIDESTIELFSKEDPMDVIGTALMNYINDSAREGTPETAAIEEAWKEIKVMANRAEVTLQQHLLPDDWWETVEKWFPKYSSSDDILHNDIMTRYVDGELDDGEHDDDMERMLEEYGTPDQAAKHLIQNNIELYLDAIHAELECLRKVVADVTV
jgi:hypothetical protein